MVFKLKQFIRLLVLIPFSHFVYAVPKTVVSCTEDQCNHIAPILNPGEKLLDQAIIYQTSNQPEFMSRVEKTRSSHNNGGWQQIIIDETAFSQTQPVIGFGGAFTDSAAMLFHQMTAKLQDEFIDAYYSQQGIAYSLGRVPMASNDFSCREEINGKPTPSVGTCSTVFSLYSYADVADETLKNFSLQPEDIDYKIPMIHAALAKAHLNLFASPWSAPAWMKTNGSMIHGSLLSVYQQTWANYFVKFLQMYKNYGITFWGITVQNEPEEKVLLKSEERGMQSWQTMYLSKDQEAIFIKRFLGPAIKQYAFNTHLIMHDGQISTLNDRISMMDDVGVAKYVDGAALHWYMNSDSKYSNLNAIYQKLNKDQQSRFILASEACEGYLPFFPGPSLGDWSRGEAYGHDIISDLNHHVSGWTDWNLVLDMQGGPNWANNKVDAAILYDASKQTFYEQPMYFYLGHFSKFIRPGSRLLDTQSSGPFPLEEVSFKVPAYQNLPETIVVVVLNRDVTGRNYYIENTSIKNGNKYLNLHIPAHAIQTIIFKAANILKI